MADEQAPAPGVPRRRPGGRNALVVAAARRAVLELLSEKSWSDITLAQVAERAGIHQATIYRRWGNFQGLVVDAMTTEFGRINPVRDTGSLRGDLEAFAIGSAEVLTGSYGYMFLRALVTIRTEAGLDDPLPEGVEQLRRAVEGALERARARGEATPSLDHVLECILGGLYFRLLFGSPNTPEVAHELVDRVLGPPEKPAGGTRRRRAK